MNNLIRLELKRNSLKPFHIAVGIITIIMLGLVYLFAAMPKIEGTDTDMELFLSYRTIFGLSMIICMGIFSVMSAVMAAKFIVDDYSDKKAILLFSYPIERKKVLDAKILLVFLYTAITVFFCGIFIFTIFFVTESLFPLCLDTISIQLIMNCLIALILYALMTGFLSMIALWFGFRKKSIIGTIVAACIIISVICQLIALTLFSDYLLFVAFLTLFILMIFVRKSLHHQVENMEV